MTGNSIISFIKASKIYPVCMVALPQDFRRCDLQAWRRERQEKSSREGAFCSSSCLPSSRHSGLWLPVPLSGVNVSWLRVWWLSFYGFVVLFSFSLSRICRTFCYFCATLSILVAVPPGRRLGLLTLQHTLRSSFVLVSGDSRRSSLHFRSFLVQRWFRHLFAPLVGFFHLGCHGFVILIFRTPIVC